MEGNAKLFVLFLLIPLAKGSIPGSFFWSPRLGIDLSVPTTMATRTKVQKPSVSAIKAGTVVLIDGYQIGLTALALASGFEAWNKFPHLNPFSAWFYTTAYRWGLRHLSLLPLWLQGTRYSYIDTHRAYRRRFYYMEKFVPEWLRWFLPHVMDWHKERHQFRRYLRYADPAFAKHLHYPSEVFNNWESEETTETVENLDISSFSIHVPVPDYIDMR